MGFAVWIDQMPQLGSTLTHPHPSGLNATIQPVTAAVPLQEGVQGGEQETEHGRASLTGATRVLVLLSALPASPDIRYLYDELGRLVLGDPRGTERGEHSHRVST